MSEFGLFGFMLVLIFAPIVLTTVGISLGCIIGMSAERISDYLERRRLRQQERR